MFFVYVVMNNVETVNNLDSCNFTPVIVFASAALKLTYRIAISVVEIKEQKK